VDDDEELFRRGGLGVLDEGLMLQEVKQIEKAEEERHARAEESEQQDEAPAKQQTDHGHAEEPAHD